MWNSLSMRAKVLGLAVVMIIVVGIVVTVASSGFSSLEVGVRQIMPVGESSGQVTAEFLESISADRLQVRTWFGVAVFVGLALGVMISSDISSRIRKVTAVAERMASGDLSSRVKVKRNDEISNLVRLLNKTIIHVSSIIHNVCSEVTVLGNSSKELKTVSGILSESVDVTRTRSESVATASEGGYAGGYSGRRGAAGHGRGLRKGQAGPDNLP